MAKIKARVGGAPAGKGRDGVGRLVKTAKTQRIWSREPEIRNVP